MFGASSEPRSTGKGAILGDEMGLGKTLTSVGLLCALKESGKPSLVLAPLSVLGGWKTEFAVRQMRAVLPIERP